MPRPLQTISGRPMKLHERPIEDLPISERSILYQAVQDERASTVRVIEVWNDDHVDCVGLEITTPDNLIVQVGFWWYDQGEDETAAQYVSRWEEWLHTEDHIFDRLERLVQNWLTDYEYYVDMGWKASEQEY